MELLVDANSDADADADADGDGVSEVIAEDEKCIREVK